MLQIDNTVLAVVDVQGRLAELMHEKESLYANLQKLIQGAKILGLPILWAEQNPERMGLTVPNVQALLQEGSRRIRKMSFSCCRESAFMKELQATKRRQVLLAGIEAHVCIYQTACDLLAGGYVTEIVVDAVSSRTRANKAIGLERAHAVGAGLLSVEMALFELMGTADHPAFRDVLKLVK